MSAQLGKRTNGKNKCIDGTPTEMVSKGKTQKSPRSLGMGTSECASLSSLVGVLCPPDLSEVSRPDP